MDRRHAGADQRTNKRLRLLCMAGNMLALHVQDKLCAARDLGHDATAIQRALDNWESAMRAMREDVKC